MGELMSTRFQLPPLIAAVLVAPLHPKEVI
jgi:hypothetical protein